MTLVDQRPDMPPMPAGRENLATGIQAVLTDTYYNLLRLGIPEEHIGTVASTFFSTVAPDRRFVDKYQTATGEMVSVVDPNEHTATVWLPPTEDEAQMEADRLAQEKINKEKIAAERAKYVDFYMAPEAAQAAGKLAYEAVVARDRANQSARLYRTMGSLPVARFIQGVKLDVHRLRAAKAERASAIADAEWGIVQRQLRGAGDRVIWHDEGVAAVENDLSSLQRKLTKVNRRLRLLETMELTGGQRYAKNIASKEELEKAIADAAVRVNELQTNYGKLEPGQKHRQHEAPYIERRKQLRVRGRVVFGLLGRKKLRRHMPTEKIHGMPDKLEKRFDDLRAIDNPTEEKTGPQKTDLPKYAPHVFARKINMPVAPIPPTLTRELAGKLVAPVGTALQPVLKPIAKGYRTVRNAGRKVIIKANRVFSALDLGS